MACIQEKLSAIHIHATIRLTDYCLSKQVLCDICCQYMYLYFHYTLGVVEVYGSWKKVAPRLESSVFELEVEKQLEEAMAEQDTHCSVTIVSTSSSSAAKTGFHTHDEDY